HCETTRIQTQTQPSTTAAQYTPKAARATTAPAEPDARSQSAVQPYPSGKSDHEGGQRAAFRAGLQCAGGGGRADVDRRGASQRGAQRQARVGADGSSDQSGGGGGSQSRVSG